MQQQCMDAHMEAKGFQHGKKKEKVTKEFGQPNLSYPSLLIENIHTF